MKQILNIALLWFTVFLDTKVSAKRFGAPRVQNREDALAWFNNYGYNPCFNSTVQCSLSFNSILEDYQRRFHLKVTGNFDQSTKEHMNRPRCGNKDKSVGELKSIAQLTTYKWSRSSLTYSLRSYPTELSQTATKTIIREAFKAWIDHIPLKIEEKCPTCAADFVLDFSRDDHRDNYAFDGAGGTLAHAFFPEDGRVHFDKDEIWTERFDDGKTNLYLVAVHEIGHALGLEHTYDQNSIMYPSYQLMAKSDILPQPDRTAIQGLYGNKQSSTATPPSTMTTITTRTPTRGSVTYPAGKSHPRCRLFLDAAFGHPDGTFHTFNAGILWRYLPDDGTWEERASTYGQMYSNLPKQLGAGVYNTRTKQALFFTNARVYQYEIDSYNRARFRKEHKLSRSLQNSIIGAIYYRNEVYVITGTMMRSFQIDSIFQQSSERALKDEFPRLPGAITTAFSYGDLHHFFTNDRLVYVWSEQLNAWKTFAKPMESNWFACSGTDTYGIQETTTHKSNKHRDSSHHHHHHHHRDSDD